MLFPEVDFYERFALAKSAGVDAIEFWKWSNKDLNKIQSKLKTNNLSVAVFNLDSQDEKLSADLSRGILNAGRVDDFINALKETIRVYKALNAEALIVLIGERLGIPYDEQINNIIRCLEEAVPLLKKENVCFLSVKQTSQGKVACFLNIFIYLIEWYTVSFAMNRFVAIAYTTWDKHIYFCSRGKI